MGRNYDFATPQPDGSLVVISAAALLITQRTEHSTEVL